MFPTYHILSPLRDAWVSETTIAKYIIWVIRGVYYMGALVGKATGFQV